MSRTSIDLNDKLVQEGLKISDCKTKKELVNHALRKFVNRLKRKSVLKLMGSDRCGTLISSIRNVSTYE